MKPSAATTTSSSKNSGQFQSASAAAEVTRRATELDREVIDRFRVETTQRLFAALATLWAVSVVAALWVAPSATKLDAAASRELLWTAVLGGAIVIAIPAWLQWRQGAKSIAMRHSMAVAQMLMSGILMTASGGSGASYFCPFGLLALLSTYHDWRVLRTASATVIGEQILRLLLAVLGGARPDIWVPLQFAVWIAFEAVALSFFANKARRQMLFSARQQAQHEIVRENIAAEVEARTRSLRASESRYSLVFRHSPLPMWLFEPDSMLFIDVNDRATLVFGYSNAQFLDMSFSELLAPEELEKAQGLVSEVLAGHSICAELKHRTQTGELRDVEITAHKVDFSGSDAILMLANDVTFRRSAEREKEQMEVQLRHAQKLESIGQLASGIAHEINTPTQYVGDNLHFLRDAFSDVERLLEAHEEALPAIESLDAARAASLRELASSVDLEYLSGEIPKSIEQALEGVDRVSTLVRAMKEFSHPGRQEKTLSDINHAILGTITVTRNEWKYVCGLETDLQPDLPAAPCLLSDFNQVILNLIINAVHAIAARVESRPDAGPGLIRISTRDAGEQIEIRVADNGGGIPEEIRSRIFDPFFTTKEVGKGTGQGLAIAHSVIADKHGGEIFFETEPGVGTTFIIRLPLAPQAAEEVAAADLAEATTAAAAELKGTFSE